MHDRELAELVDQRILVPKDFGTRRITNMATASSWRSTKSKRKLASRKLVGVYIYRVDDDDDDVMM